MPEWMKFAFVSMFFAGFTSVIAKHGLRDISGEMAILTRTVFVFILISVISFRTTTLSQLSQIRNYHLMWLGLSAVTTSLSLIYYYKALKQGDVATVTLIDKGSILVTMLMAWLFLHESITIRMIIGAMLIIAGLIVISKK